MNTFSENLAETEQDATSILTELDKGNFQPKKMSNDFISIANG